MRKHGHLAALTGLLLTLTSGGCSLFGEEDTATPPDRAHELAALRPDAELVLLPATGHLTCLERPAEVAAALTRLVARSS